MTDSSRRLAVCLALLPLPSAAVAATKPANGALFVSQSAPPAAMIAGDTFKVTVTMKNSGRNTWTAAAGYKLGAQSPADTQSFRVGRVPLAEASVAPGKTAAFSFNAIAPAKPGTYDFQWRMVQERKEWFGQLTPKVQITVSAKKRRGKVRLDGWQAVDDDGPFNAVGFTFMSGLRLYRNKDKNAQMDKDLDAAAAAGYHFARILGEVGWGDGNAVDPNWPDYDEVLTGYIKHAWSKGIRTELTVFGGSTWSGDKANRKAFVDRVVKLVQPLQDAIMVVQIVNEPGNAGQFNDPDEAAGYAKQFQTAMPGVIASLGAVPGGQEKKYKDLGFPFTPHLDRSQLGTPWRPMRQPWDPSDYLGKWSNDEPIGPGSSVAEEKDCDRLKALHMMTFIGKGFATVFHSGAGVVGVPRMGYTSGQVSDMPCFKDIPKAVGLLPRTLPQYTRKNGQWGDAPFNNLDPFNVGGDTGRGSMRNYSGVSGDDFATMVLNVPVGEKLQCNTVTGTVVAYKLSTLEVSDTFTCTAGGTFELGPGSRLLRRPISSKPD